MGVFSNQYPQVIHPGPITSERLVFIDCPAETVEAFRLARDVWFQGTGPRQPGELQLVITGSLSTPRLRSFREDPSPILVLGIRADQVTFGPLQIAGRSVCLACLQYWTVTSGWDLRDRFASEFDTETIKLVIHSVSNFMLEFEREGAIAGLANSLTLIDVATGVGTDHPIFPRRSCPACCNLSEKETKDLSVHCSPVTGIVKQLRCFEEPIGGVFQAGAVSTGPLSVTGETRPFSYAVSWGRGMSPSQAKNSCIGEALEFYSAAYRGNEKMNRGTLAEIHASIDPRTILLYSAAQYQSRHHSNLFLGERDQIPETFDYCHALDWLQGTNLIDGKVAWVPAACCLLHYQFRPNEPKFAVADRAGCATGISYSDALAGALLELIEHDAVAIWWYNQIQRPEISLESFDCPNILALRDALFRLGRKLWLLDVTNDLGIPAYVAVSTMHDGTELLFGAAAHPSPRIAAEKAATEVSHLWMCTRIAEMPADFIPWLQTATLKNQSYFVPTCQLNSPSEPGAMTSSEVLDLCVERLKRSQLNPIAINLTRSDVILHAVRAVVPGMFNTRNRRAPGRLYDVPVKMGWLQKPHAEMELNPIGCVF